MQGKPYEMAGCISVLLGSPAYATEIPRFIALAKIAEQMADKKTGITILGGIGYHFEEAVRIALLDAEFPMDLANIVLWQRMSHLMYKKSLGLAKHIKDCDAEPLVKNIKKHANRCEFFAFQNLAAAIIKIAANLGDGFCEKELRDLVLAGQFCQCPICDNIAIGTKKILEDFQETNED